MTQKLLTENRAIDLFVTYRFLKLLVTPWNKQKTYKLGIIDKNGSRIKSKKLVTSDEKSAFTLLHRLVFNCKRIMSKIPLVRTQLGTYVTGSVFTERTLRNTNTRTTSDQVSDGK